MRAGNVGRNRRFALSSRLPRWNARNFDGEFAIDFHREAKTLEEAINSAIGNVKSAGYAVERVEIEAENMPQPV